MLHITEDTPADMLSGAMDLTIHLPSGKATKMCVERCTPMMDLLVQITTNQQLQITNYTLQPIQTSPDASYPERILSYYPNTPIGALDTQHVRVIPKTRTLPVPKNIPPGHQPFESTFRLKVHLPRNQLYVTRVSRHVHIEDIMRKVCEEKNLDPNKCEVRHPGNLDEVLDPKLTLNDYMITEIYLILKGTNSLTQAFSTNDIMALRREEERKRMHNKTGGGVFNLIFRRGKSNTGSGSISTTDSMAPTLIDDTRTETPQVTPVQIILSPKTETQTEKPKAPQRKRRPAPKPPQIIEKPQNELVEEKVSSVVSDSSTASDIAVKNETNLTICHSRHSSDSSGYHETSILSDHCNTSLPRKSRLEDSETGRKSLNRYSESTGNLTSMTAQSRSTSSLAFPARKKKAAPPPPSSLQKSANSTTTLEKPSPVVASQTPVSSSPLRTDLNLALQGTQNTTNPPPAPRRKKGPVPLPRPRSSLQAEEHEKSRNEFENSTPTETTPTTESNMDSIHSCPYHDGELIRKDEEEKSTPQKMSTMDILRSLEYLNLDDEGNEIKPPEIIGVLTKSNQEDVEQHESDTDLVLKKRTFKLNLVDPNIDDDNSSEPTESPMREDLSSLDSDISNLNIKTTRKQLRKDFSVTSLKSSESVLFEEGGMQRWGSWEKLNNSSTPSTLYTPTDVEFEPSIVDTNDKGDESSQNEHCHDESKGQMNKESSKISLRSTDMTPVEAVNLKRWGSTNKLNHCSSEESNCSGNLEVTMKGDNSLPNLISKSEEDSKLMSTETYEIEDSSRTELLDESLNGQKKWVVGGDNSDAESVSSVGIHSAQNKLNSERIPESSSDIQLNSHIIENSKDKKTSELLYNEIDHYVDYEKSPQDSGNSSDISEKSKLDEEFINEDILDNHHDIEVETEEWQLPSPPKAFKDSTPNYQNEHTEMTVVDSVITPELLEKLKQIEDLQAEETNCQSDNASTLSEDRLILSKLSLENLEKRKSLVYNRELATSLKIPYNSFRNHEETNPLTNKIHSDLDLSKTFNQFEKTLEDIRISNQEEEETSQKIRTSASQSTLPNFKITTYDEPKNKIKVFEDDTIRSNSDSTANSKSLNRAESLQKSYIGRSMENISSRQFSADDVFKRPRDVEPRAPRPKSHHYRRPVNRSGSFSADKNEWSPSKPVARSKSQVAIKREEIPSNLLQTENTLRSSSLYDVSGLQSLEVMRKIQNKLNTPTTSVEALTKIGHEKRETRVFQQEEIQDIPQKKLQYSGPPSINMGTWSERPKVPVCVKEDDNYKSRHGTNKTNSKIIVSTQNDSLKSNNSVEIRHTTVNKLYSYPNKTENQSVTIKVNGSEPISTQENGNVLIKIGEHNSQEFKNEMIYRSPMYNLNKNSPRPHSVAFPSDFDISRIPVVRSVELKKTFKDSPNNTSVTQLNQPNGNYFSNGYSFKSKYSSNENLYNNNNGTETNSKPVFRAKSFLQASPVVKGFRNFENSNGVNAMNNINKMNRHSWQPNTSMTLPANTSKVSSLKQQDSFTTNRNVPFSKFNLRRTESKKILEDERSEDTNEIDNIPKSTSHANSKFVLENGNKNVPKFTPVIKDTSYNKNILKSSVQASVPPPPPQMPKIVQKKISNRQFVPVLDPRDELLKSIRDFGGKKGLSRKA